MFADQFEMSGLILFHSLQNIWVDMPFKINRDAGKKNLINECFDSNNGFSVVSEGQIDFLSGKDWIWNESIFLQKK